MNAIICDLDGTLCLRNGREWNDYGRVGEDLPNRPVLEMLSLFAAFPKWEVLLVSGREDIDYCRSLTELWLKSYAVSYAALFMRRAKDYRDDVEVKREIYEREIKNRWDVLMVLDDRNKVVRMWREIGLPCFQVAEGDF